MYKRPQADILALTIATVAEFTGLFFWVEAVDAGYLYLGLLFITVGLLCERIAVYISIRAVYGDKPPHPHIFWNLFGAGIGEALAWLLWLFIADKWDNPWSHEVAALVLTIIILIEHSIQLGYFRRAKALSHVLHRTTIIFSCLEGLVAYFWLITVREDHLWWGAAILFFGLTFEHVIQGRLLGLEDVESKKLPKHNSMDHL